MLFDSATESKKKIDTYTYYAPQIRRQMSLYLQHEKSILGCGLGLTVKKKVWAHYELTALKKMMNRDPEKTMFFWGLLTTNKDSS